MPSIVMFDDVTVSLLPEGFDAYAAYTDGLYANLAQVRAKFPHAHVLSIAVRASDVADCLDIEPGDASNAQAPAWFKAALRAGVTKPCVYTSASNVNALVSVMTAAGIKRSAYRVWSAHYGQGQHICGPSTCKECSVAADATQYTDRAMGKSLDESICSSEFFTLVTPPAPAPYPTLTLGDKDQPGEVNGPVHFLQERLNTWHANPLVALDSSFGPKTLKAVEDFQKARSLTVDGIVGPQTWMTLLKAPPVLAFAAPAGLRVTAGIISVSWDAVASVEGKAPDGYTLTVSDAGHVVKTVNVKGTTAVVEDLTRNKSYDVEVHADGGQGTPGSAKISVTA